MGGFRTIDLSDDVVKSRKIGAQEVKLGGFVHYAKLTDIEAAFVVATVPSGGAVVKHPLGKKPAGVIPITMGSFTHIVIHHTDFTTTHFSVHTYVHGTTVHMVVF